MIVGRRLTGRRVVTTRELRGPLDSMLAAAGADVLHVPLVEVADAPDGGVALAAALDRLDEFDWLVVTSRHGADRTGARARACSGVGLAAVGPSSADLLGRLAGRAVAIVPRRSTAADLVRAFAGRRGTALVAQADRADDLVGSGLREAGLAVEVVTAYSTRLRRPTDAERAAALGADAVTFASGSAVEAWVAGIGPTAPPVVVAIGPSTAAAGERLGLKATHVAADHDVNGLAATVIDALAD